jgi:hypothetical protein
MYFLTTRYERRNCRNWSESTLRKLQEDLLISEECPPEVPTLASRGKHLGFLHDMPQKWVKAAILIPFPSPAIRIRTSISTPLLPDYSFQMIQVTAHWHCFWPGDFWNLVNFQSSSTLYSLMFLVLSSPSCPPSPLPAYTPLPLPLLPGIPPSLLGISGAELVAALHSFINSKGEGSPLLPPFWLTGPPSCF